MFWQRKESPVWVLIMDSNEVDLLTLEQRFELSTLYRIKTFGNPEALLGFISQGTPGKRETAIAIISLEITGPDAGERGLAFVRQVKEANPNIDIIVLSSTPEKSLPVKAIQFGAFTAIRKTGNSFIRIQNAIKWLLGQKELRQKRKNAIISIGVFLCLVILTIGLWIAYFSYT